MKSKSIDLFPNPPSLNKVLELADQGHVILRTREGREYLVAEIDDFCA